MTGPHEVARREARYRGLSILLSLAYLLLLALRLQAPAFVVGGLFLYSFGRLCTLGGWLDGYGQRRG